MRASGMFSNRFAVAASTAAVLAVGCSATPTGPTASQPAALAGTLGIGGGIGVLTTGARGARRSAATDVHGARVPGYRRFHRHPDRHPGRPLSRADLRPDWRAVHLPAAYRVLRVPAPRWSVKLLQNPGPAEHDVESGGGGLVFRSRN